MRISISARNIPVWVCVSVVSLLKADESINWANRSTEIPAVQTIVASSGHTIQKIPGGEVIKVVRESAEIHVKAYVDWNGQRYYISDWSWDRMAQGHPPNWIAIHPGDKTLGERADNGTGSGAESGWREPRTLEKEAGASQLPDPGTRDDGEGFPYRLQLQHRDEEVEHLCFDPASSLMATAAFAEKMRLWNGRAGRVLWEKSLPKTVVKPVGFTHDHNPVVLETRHVENPSRFGFNMGERAQGYLVTYDACSAKPLAEFEFPLTFETAADTDSFHPFVDGWICLDPLPNDGPAPDRVRVIEAATGKTDQVDAAPFLAKRRLWNQGNRWSNRWENDAVALPNAAGEIRIALDRSAGRLTATCQGKLLWTSELLPGATGMIGFGPVCGDASGQYIWWDSKPNMAYGPFGVVEAATGRKVFSYRNWIEDIPNLFLRPGTAECWLVTTPAKEGHENPSATVLSRVPLDGSNRLIPVPLEGILQRANNAEFFGDRYLVVANAEGPQAFWCWDLATLRLLWWRPSVTYGQWADCSISREGNAAVVKWTYDGQWDAVDLESGRPVNLRSPGDATKNHLRLADRCQSAIARGGLVLETSRKDLQYMDPEYRFPDGTRSRLLAATSSAELGVFSDSREVFLWRFANGQRVSLAVLGGERVEWIAYTKDGYFEASPRGGSLLCAIDGVEPYPIDQFALRFNRPDILLERLGTAQPKLLAELKELHQRRQAKAQVAEEQARDKDHSVATPSVRLRGSRVEAGAATLDVVAEDPLGQLASILAFVNDVPVHDPTGRVVTGGKAEETLRVPLGAGTNKIEVSCRCVDGRESPRVLAQFDGGAPREKPALFYLGVGCSDYEDSRLPALAYTVKDCRDLAALFEQLKGGFREVKTMTLADREVGDDLLGKVRTLTAEARIDDLFVLFLAGHGVREGGIYYYLPSTSRLDQLKDTAIPFSMLESLLEALPNRRRLLLIDTCESGDAAEGAARSEMSKSTSAGSTRGRGLRARTIRPIPTNSTSTDVMFASRELRRSYCFNDLFRRTGSVVFTACQANESSFESDNLKNGLFTAALLRAFSDASADANRDGLVSKGELSDFVTQAVARLALESGMKQTPALERDNLEETLNLPTLAVPDTSSLK